MMNRNRVTAQTTEESLLAEIQAEKDAMVRVATEAAASEYHQGETLLSAAQNVRTTEVLVGAKLGYLRVILGSNNDTDARKNFLFTLIARGADDSWSGRKNDSNRSAHDAVTGWARDEFDNIRYEG